MRVDIEKYFRLVWRSFARKWIAAEMARCLSRFRRRSCKNFSRGAGILYTRSFLLNRIDFRFRERHHPSTRWESKARRRSRTRSDTGCLEIIITLTDHASAQNGQYCRMDRIQWHWKQFFSNRNILKRYLQILLDVFIFLQTCCKLLGHPVYTHRDICIRMYSLKVVFLFSMAVSRGNQYSAMNFPSDGGRTIYFSLERDRAIYRRFSFFPSLGVSFVSESERRPGNWE